MPSHPSPVVLNSPTDEGRKLVAATVVASEERSEDWFRNTLFEHPELLPVDFFGDRFAPLIPLGVEVGSGNGPMDALFVSPHGRLTIVETKLWKNPERHRDVVAQIVGYARSLSRMSIAELNEAVRSETDNGDDMDAIVRRALAGGPHALENFYEKLATRLPTGDFLLLIVGDRISPNAAMLGGAIAGAPGLHFTMGFVELQLCGLGDGGWPILVVPHVVGRKVERERFVVRIERGEVVVEPPGRSRGVEGEAATDARLYATVDDFLADPDLDEHARPAYARGVAQLGDFGGRASVSKRHVYFDFDVDGEEINLLAMQDYRIGIMRAKDWADFKSPADARERYLSALSAIPAVRLALASGRTWIRHDRLTTLEIDRIIDATLQLGAALVRPSS